MKIAPCQIKALLLLMTSAAASAGITWHIAKAKFQAEADERVAEIKAAYSEEWQGVKFDPDEMDTSNMAHFVETEPTPGVEPGPERPPNAFNRYSNLVRDYSGDDRPDVTITTVPNHIPDTRRPVPAANTRAVLGNSPRRAP